MSFKTQGFNKGKVVYWANGAKFENSSGKRDGREKAEKYCLQNMMNTKCIQKFDSRTEVARYEYLLEQARIGEISNLDHHFTLLIQGEFTNANGDIVPAITYEADFVYKTKDGRRVVEDVKGSEYFIDERFITLKQVFDAKMAEKGLYIKVVLLRNKEWVEWHIGEKKKTQKLIKKQRELLRTLKQAQHEREVLERASEREKTRLRELQACIKSGVKLNSSQLKRYNQLLEKYKI